MSYTWKELAERPIVQPPFEKKGPPSAGRITNIELYLERLPKRFSDPRITEWLKRVAEDYVQHGDVKERDFKGMWSLYVGSSHLNKPWLEERISDRFNKVNNPMKPR